MGAIFDRLGRGISHKAAHSRKVFRIYARSIEWFLEGSHDYCYVGHSLLKAGIIAGHEQRYHRIFALKPFILSSHGMFLRFFLWRKFMKGFLFL